MLGYGRDESAPTPGGVFATNFVGVRHIIIIYVTRHRKPYTTHFVNIQCIILNRPQLVYFVMVTHSENKNPLFARQKGGFCSVKKAGLHNKNEQPEKHYP